MNEGQSLIHPSFDRAPALGDHIVTIRARLRPDGSSQFVGMCSCGADIGTELRLVNASGVSAWQYIGGMVDGHLRVGR